MQQDPIGLNFYNGTGGYVWQLADTMQHDLNENIHTLELQKPTPPMPSILSLSTQVNSILYHAFNGQKMYK